MLTRLKKIGNLTKYSQSDSQRAPCRTHNATEANIPLLNFEQDMHKIHTLDIVSVKIKVPPWLQHHRSQSNNPDTRLNKATVKLNCIFTTSPPGGGVVWCAGWDYNWRRRLEWTSWADRESACSDNKANGYNFEYCRLVSAVRKEQRAEIGQLAGNISWSAPHPSELLLIQARLFSRASVCIQLKTMTITSDMKGPFAARETWLSIPPRCSWIAWLFLIVTFASYRH